MIVPLRLAAATAAWLVWLAAASGASVGQFRTGVSLVEVFATVTDQAGRPVANLSREDFTVEEDGVAQQIETFIAGGMPLAVAVAVDRSFSMGRERLERSVAAARAFMSALRPTDQVMVIAIGSETEVVAPLSSDKGGALEALGRLAPWGTTPLHDATLTALAAIQAGPGRRALVLLSDGADRYSATGAAALVAKAREMDVQVYPVAMSRDRPPLFAEIASVTGGRSIHASNGRQLERAMTMLADELRTQYLLGYAPARPDTDAGEIGWRSIRVLVKRSSARIRARDGYLAR